ncbi:hypothetical protein ACVILI_004290 [Mesorhizobium sp. USDA 4775]
MRCVNYAFPKFELEIARPKTGWQRHDKIGDPYPLGASASQSNPVSEGLLRRLEGRSPAGVQRRNDGYSIRRRWIAASEPNPAIEYEMAG